MTLSLYTTKYYFDLYYYFTGFVLLQEECSLFS